MPIHSSLFPPNALRNAARIHGTLVALVLISACAADRPDPMGVNARISASVNGVPFTEGLASPGWQATARSLVAQAGFTPVTAGHAYPIVGVAQYLAAAPKIHGGTNATLPRIKRKSRTPCSLQSRRPTAL